MWHRVAVGDSSLVQGTEVSTRSPITRGAREDQLLEEGWIIPSSSMWSNLWRVMRNLSEARQRVRADTGGPVVVIWWHTLCLICRLAAYGCVNARN